MRFDGHQLKALREARKWDQHRLAERARQHGVGVTQSQISRYENGKEPSGRNVVALAAALGIEPRDLYDDDPPEAAAMAAGGPLTDTEYAMYGRLHARAVAAAMILERIEAFVP